VLAAISMSGQQRSKNSDIPAYNPAPPPKGYHLPPIMSMMELAGLGLQHPAQLASYKAAAKYPNVMYQLPCYCYCDRNHGHNSLHACFESTHGANCSTCMAEALFAADQTKKGKTVKQIRDAINAGAWKTVDLQHPE